MDPLFQSYGQFSSIAETASPLSSSESFFPPASDVSSPQLEKEVTQASVRRDSPISVATRVPETLKEEKCLQISSSVSGIDLLNKKIAQYLQHVKQEEGKEDNEEDEHLKEDEESFTSFSINKLEIL